MPRKRPLARTRQLNVTGGTRPKKEKPSAARQTDKPDAQRTELHDLKPATFWNE